VHVKNACDILETDPACVVRRSITNTEKIVGIFG
jgi:hypothetical protein